ncbi:MAG: hypothetical protein JNG88_12030 [Phycisphaerales bacterium]|nr:hypothetical protein [Phycisphaerales bacterium]
MTNRYLNRARPAAFALSVWLAIAAGAALGGEHPRLLIGVDDLPRIRHACGVESAGAAGGKSGANFADYRAVRDHFGVNAPGELMSGELLAIAFLHLVDGSTTTDAMRMNALSTWFRKPDWTAIDLIEASIALDWCWSDLDPETRRDFLAEVRRRIKPFAPTDNPLDHRAFRERLGALALAVAVDEQDDGSAAWNGLRRQILADSVRFLEGQFAGYVTVRGLGPTVPESAADEECDAAWLIELAQKNGAAAWAAHRETIGRWMEHYAFSRLITPPMNFQFAHDGGIRTGATPSLDWRDLRPLTAHLIAARTRDAAAARVAALVEAEMRSASAPPEAAIWRWAPIVFLLEGIAPIEAGDLPGARNLGSAVFLRGGDPGDQTLIRVDAGGVYLRRNQHFDAGGFVIYRGGYVTGGGDEHIALEAVPGKNGSQRLGRDRQPFDFNQYAASTIAHNCLIFFEPARPVDWHGRKYRPIGGQKLFEDGTGDFSTAATVHPQRTGKLVALGESADISYAAVDLAAAYPADRVAEYTREFALLWGRVLLVIDRARPVGSKTTTNFVLHIPTRPTVAEGDLPPDRRVAGNSNDGGVWKLGDVPSVEWRGEGGGALIPLWPGKTQLVIAGGPAQAVAVTDGSHKGVTYVGGDENSFERLIQPAGQGENENAWYRLGAPTILGPQFGVPAHWGRIELEHPRGGQVMFVNAIVLDRASTTSVTLEGGDVRDQPLRVQVRCGQRAAEVELPRGPQVGGRVRWHGPDEQTWEFPAEIVPEGPLRGR